jgi:hypothetical protein
MTPIAALADWVRNPTAVFTSVMKVVTRRRQFSGRVHSILMARPLARSAAIIFQRGAIVYGGEIDLKLAM